jgi:Peptidase family M23
MPRQRATAIVAAGLLFVLGAAAALADGTTTMTTTTATTITAATTTTATTITAATTTTATTTTADSTTTATTAATTAPTTTAPPPTTTAASVGTPSTTDATTSIATTSTSPPTRASGRATVASAALAHGCPLVGAAILLPHRDPLVLGPIAGSRLDAVRLSLRYPADGSIVAASTVTLNESACTERRPAHARARLRSLSLFAGAITASRVTLALGVRDAATFVGLTVDGRRTRVTGGGRVPLQGWGYLVGGPATAVRLPGGVAAVSALAVHLLRAHSGLPAGTVVLVAVATVPAAAAAAAPGKRTPGRRHHHRRRHSAIHEPLKVTPPLGMRRYVFPVVGPSDYVDTYGAFRSDVPGNWHHGDDIFAPLGAPVVAVSDGTINRVGWEKIGGWRLWVRDSVGDEFYYAHLSGYAPTDLHSNRVNAGEVIGFIGNTGDAFTTSPHLHFEIHPRPLLHLGYDGAVDPTKYLDSWTHLQDVHVPLPTHPPLPKQPLIRREARYVFRELLAARHLIRHAPRPSTRPHVRIAPGANAPPLHVPTAMRAVASAPRPSDHAPSHSPPVAALAAALGVLALAATIMLRQRWRRRRDDRQTPDAGAGLDSGSPAPEAE